MPLPSRPLSPITAVRVRSFREADDKQIQDRVNLVTS